MGGRRTSWRPGGEALEVAAERQPDLVVLDVMLPDIDGFTVFRRLRDNGIASPVIFLTARESTEDRVRGLTIGGDDYLTKPFSVEELVARCRLILRRAGADYEQCLRYSDLEMDEEGHQVRRGDTLIRLSPTEYKLLRYLLLNSGRVLSRRQILDHVWEYDFKGDGSNVEAFISLLRRKVDALRPTAHPDGARRRLRPEGRGLLGVAPGSSAMGRLHYWACLASSAVAILSLVHTSLVNELDHQLTSSARIIAGGPPLPPGVKAVPVPLQIKGTTSPFTDVYIADYEQDGALVACSRA